MVLTASLCDAPHINELGKYTQRECICDRVAPDYAADLYVPILDRFQNAKEREIGSSTIYCVDLIIIIVLKVIEKSNL